MTHYHTYFPAALKIEDRRVVIVGGDDEATKKAREVLRCHARLTVISPTVTPELEELAGEDCLTLQRRPYADGDLAGAMLAIVCDRTMAPAIRAEAQQRGVLLNVLDRP
jgi:siroheme synthase-like protein